MTGEHRTKIFKSGNSPAIRLPKAMGFVEGDEVALVRHADGGISFWKVELMRETFMGLYGSMSSGFMANGRGDTEQDERDWSVRPNSAEAA